MVARTAQKITRDLPRIHPDRTLRQRREHALQPRQVQQRFQPPRTCLPRLPEVTQRPKRFLADQFSIARRWAEPLYRRQRIELRRLDLFRVRVEPLEEYFYAAPLATCSTYSLFSLRSAGLITRFR